MSSEYYTHFSYRSFISYLEQNLWHPFKTDWTLHGRRGGEGRGPFIVSHQCWGQYTCKPHPLHDWFSFGEKPSLLIFSWAYCPLYNLCVSIHAECTSPVLLMGIGFGVGFGTATVIALLVGTTIITCCLFKMRRRHQGKKSWRQRLHDHTRVTHVLFFQIQEMMTL